ncbi:potassium transporter TrkG [Cereibacter sp. SYSU M97828]|nr:potassium transporter TrkG [Cereibacter flavus]
MRAGNVPFLVILMAVAGLAMFLPASHALVLGDHAEARAFFYSGVLLLMLTSLIAIATANHRPPNLARSHLAGLLGAYAILPLLFAVPFFIAVPDTTFGNAWFEMLSAFTTTGATIYDRPGRLGETLHLWRALVGWLGGFFVLLNAVAVLAPLNLGGTEVVSGRPPGRLVGGWIETAEPSERLVRHATALFPAYGGLTLLLWGALLTSGEPGLVALSYAMGTLSTSGIAPGWDFADAPMIRSGEVLVFVFFVVAITRRMIPGAVLVDRSRPLREDPEIVLAVMLMLSAPAMLILRHWLGSVDYVGGVPQFLQALWGSIFTTLSFMTTTGYVSGGWDVARGWSGLGSSGLILMGLAIVGGGVGTAAGGVTLLRVHALFSHSRRELERIVHPSSVGGGGTAGRRIRGEGAYVAWIFFMLFAISIAVTMLALALTGLGFEQAVIFSVAALSTTGPLAAVAGEAPIFWSDLGMVQKTILGFAMILGRIETLAILALFSPAAWWR